MNAFRSFGLIQQPMPPQADLFSLHLQKCGSQAVREYARVFYSGQSPFSEEFDISLFSSHVVKTIKFDKRGCGKPKDVFHIVQSQGYYDNPRTYSSLNPDSKQYEWPSAETQVL